MGFRSAMRNDVLTLIDFSVCNKVVNASSVSVIMTYVLSSVARE